MTNPDDTLAIIKRLAKRVEEEHFDDSLCDLAKYVLRLSDWIECGGELPAEWDVRK